MYSHNLKSVCNAFNEIIENYNENVIGQSLGRSDGSLMDRQLIDTIKERHINRSCYTYLNSKEALLTYVKKGIFVDWGEMNASKNMKNVRKMAQRG